MAQTKTSRSHPGVWYSLAVGRILLAGVFLWAFFDKVFGLGFATPVARSWVNGGSPTAGFLGHVEGPFAGLFTPLAGQVWADWLFMIGLLAIGVALLFGIGVRIAAVTGSILLGLMWLASFPLETNPIIDDHLVYITLLAALAYGVTHQKLSLGTWWRSLPAVKKHRWLW